MFNSDALMSVKDMVVAIPAIASALALCWEVGSFLPVSGAAFSYFTITEHISFALPALPFAILASIGGLAGAVAGNWRTNSKVELPIISNGLLIGALAFAYGYRSAFFAGMALTGALLSACLLISAPASQRRAVAACALLSLIVLAVTQGVDFTRGRLNKEELTDITTSDGTIQAVTFRAGERGVLVYDRARQRFEFLRWDAIRRMNWSRAPIRLEGALGRTYFRD